MFKFIKSMPIIFLTAALAMAGSASAQETASVQGRHGSYDVTQFGSATVQIKAFGWRNAFSLKAYAASPENHGGSVDRALRILSQDQLPYIKLKVDSSIRAFAKYSLLLKSVRKNRSKLESDKGEVDQLIQAIAAKGRSQMDNITIYYEASSGTFFLNLDGDLSQIDSSSAYFSKLLGLFNDTRAKFRIVNLR